MSTAPEPDDVVAGGSGEPQPGEPQPGGADEEAGLPPIPDALLAPLLEAAGEALRKMAPGEVPAAARRLRSFDRRGLATPVARRQLRKLLEEDQAVAVAAVTLFRARPEVARLVEAWDGALAAGGDAPVDFVAEVAADGQLPLLASALVSGLPDGFEFGLGLVVALAATAGWESEAADAVRAATADRQAAEEAARRADAARSDAEAEAARLDAALREERRARRERDRQVADAAAADARRSDLEAALADAMQRLAEAEQRTVAAEARAAAAETKAKAAEAEAAVAGTRAEAAEAKAAAVESRAAAAEAEAAAAAERRATAAQKGSGPEDQAVLQEIALAAENLAAGLRRLADRAAGPPSSLPPAPPSRSPAPAASSTPRSPLPPASPSSRGAGNPPPSPSPTSRGAGESASHPPRGGGRSTPVPAVRRPAPAPVVPPAGRRAPVRIPPGMVQDDPAAVAAMVRTPGLALIVDGYNVSMLAWPAAGAAEQRERLCDALAELQLRFRCEVTVVFDGAEVSGTPPRRRRNLRVLFSAAGQEADEVVISEVIFRPDEVPVIVVSSDREVKAAAEAEGATVLAADALLDLMRR